MKFKLDIGRQLARSSGGRENFFRRGLTIAILKESGKIPSERDKLIRVVIGTSKASMEDFKSLVGIRSRSQVELDAENIAF